MADKSLLNDVPKDFQHNPTSEEYKTIIKELIRLDVPILEVGSSSIGKSYSIRQFAEEAGVASEFLFVGTEKSEFIEGIPNLKGVTGDTAKFTYLKPYWFPDKDCIRARLIKGGTELFELANSNDRKFPISDGTNTIDYTIKGLYTKAFEGNGQYKFVEELKTALLTFKKTEEQIKEAKVKKEPKVCADVVSKYIYADSLLYISTIQGYGNFWLILDEIDKVEEQDKDKYAPLLHIVRERELKGWKLSGLRSYPEYDIKFAEYTGIRKKRLDAALDNPSVDITDTRIIAIANDLRNMEKGSPALYRRFVKIVIKESLYNPPKDFTKPSGDSGVPVGYDWEAMFMKDRQDFHTCVVDSSVPGPKPFNDKPDKVGVQKESNMVTIASQMASINVSLTGKPLDEMNLQWTLGFFPDVLFGGVQQTGTPTSTIINLLKENFNETTHPYKTMYFKIISDNFVEKYWKPAINCIFKSVQGAGAGTNDEKVKEEADDFFAKAGLSINNFNNPEPEQVEIITNKYQKIVNIVGDLFKESVAIQKTKTGSTEITGTAGNLQIRASNLVRLGFRLIEKSLINNKPTVVTKMLVSSIPFIQTKFICHSPYIPYDGSMELVEVQDENMIKLIKMITGKTFDSESQAKSAAQEVFALIEPYKPFIVRYAVGVPSNLVDSVVEGNYAAITDPKATIEEIIANGPVIIDNNILNLTSPVKDVPLRLRYFNSLANIKLIEKEVYDNLPRPIWIMITNTFENEGLNDTVKKSIDYYAERFPNAIINLAGSPNTPEEVRDYAITKANEVKANPSNYMISEIDSVIPA